MSDVTFLVIVMVLLDAISLVHIRVLRRQRDVWRWEAEAWKRHSNDLLQSSARLINELRDSTAPFVPCECSRCGAWCASAPCTCGGAP